jgi:epoxyqueuosine reductase
VLDARRCISYLTIENLGDIPRPLRAAVGTMIFGCDLCQEVCPFNAGAERTPPAPELAPLSDDRNAPDLLALLERNTNQLRQFVKRSALRRIGREQLIRNVCVALGNAGDPRALPGLERRLRDRSPLIRGHAAWALGRLAVVTPDSAAAAAAALRAAAADEADPAVAAEVAAALADAVAAAPPTSR